MRTAFLSLLIGLLSVTMIAAVVPVLAATARPSDSMQTASQTQSVTGKITAVEKNSFTLSVGSSVNEAAGHQTNDKTMTFAIDKNTTIDGKLQVGSTADVTYREANGKYIAVSVRVAS
jgi:hypothetical protein